MRRPLKGLIAGLCLFALTTGAQAADKMTIQLKWVYQAQFAGYIIAQQKGYYAKQGLDVTIKPGGPDISPAQVLAGGGADVAVDWVPDAAAVREKGVPMVNIAQFFSRAGGNIVCWKSSGIKTPEDWKGKTVAVAFGGNEFPFYAWAASMHMTATGDNPDIKVMKRGFNVDPFLQHQADCISTQIYNEYYQILDAHVDPKDLIVFYYSDFHVDTLEDGLYALQTKLADPAFMAKAVRFLAASIDGWKYAIAHPEEAAKIIVDNDPAGVANYKVQLRQMNEIAKLVGTSGKGVGYLEAAAYDNTIKVLLGATTNPIITKAPTGGWTHEVWDKAQADVK